MATKTTKKQAEQQGKAKPFEYWLGIAAAVVVIGVVALELLT